MVDFAPDCRTWPTFTTGARLESSSALAASARSCVCRFNTPNTMLAISRTPSTTSNPRNFACDFL
jgi:hypothetical protein